MVEFEARFSYEPTPDQKQTSIDVEKYLTERETQMDRLVGGDVGFGKTESCTPGHPYVHHLKLKHM